MRRRHLHPLSFSLSLFRIIWHRMLVTWVVDKRKQPQAEKSLKDTDRGANITRSNSSRTWIAREKEKGQDWLWMNENTDRSHQSLWSWEIESCILVWRQYPEKKGRYITTSLSQNNQDEGGERMMNFPGMRNDVEEGGRRDSLSDTFPLSVTFHGPCFIFFSWSLILCSIFSSVSFLSFWCFSLWLCFCERKKNEEQPWSRILFTLSMHDMSLGFLPILEEEEERRKKKMERKRLLWQQTWHGKYEISFLHKKYSLKMKKMEGRRKAKKEGEAQVIFHLH